MAKNMSIKEFQTRFKAGEFDSPDRKVQIEAGWYDWFCKDTALANKTKKLGKMVTSLYGASVTKGLIDLTKHYVFFKNNCPMVGGLYDSFSVCDIETGNVLVWVANRCIHGKRHNNDKIPLWTVVIVCEDNEKEYYFSDCLSCSLFLNSIGVK